MGRRPEPLTEDPTLEVVLEQLGAIRELAKNAPGPVLDALSRHLGGALRVLDPTKTVPVSRGISAPQIDLDIARRQTQPHGPRKKRAGAVPNPGDSFEV